jgi:uncharacterized UPF0160 family protein
MTTTTTTTAMTTGITHGGIFHGDDVMAAAILRLNFPEIEFKRVFKVSEEMIADPHAVIFDIGAGQYDHHQKGGNGCREDGSPYAAAGLIWRAFKPAGMSDKVWSGVDSCLIREIDAIDNGVCQKTPSCVSMMVSLFNPVWDSSESSDDAFEKAVEFALGILKRKIESIAATERANDIVTAVADKAVAEGTNYIVLDRFVPWQDIVRQYPAIEYVAFPSNRGGWNVQTVKDRSELPEEWRGESPAKLAEMTGLDDFSFCHNAGFIAAVGSEESARKLITIATEKAELAKAQ